MLSDRQFCVTITSAVALLSFVFFMRFLPDFVSWQGWMLCAEPNCNVQGWLGSLSGWFGAIAAFITIQFIMHQLREQKRQTDFAIGDAMPTMDAIEHLQNSAELVVRIVNWNRRGLVVRFIKVDDPNISIMPNRLVVNGERKPVEIISYAIEPFTIPGWEDRSGGPSHAEIRLAAVTGEDTFLNLARSWHDIPQIIAGIQILGDSHKVAELKADTRPLLRHS